MAFGNRDTPTITWAMAGDLLPLPLFAGIGFRGRPGIEMGGAEREHDPRIPNGLMFLWSTSDDTSGTGSHSDASLGPRSGAPGVIGNSHTVASAESLQSVLLTRSSLGAGSTRPTIGSPSSLPGEPSGELDSEVARRDKAENQTQVARTGDAVSHWGAEVRRIGFAASTLASFAENQWLGLGNPQIIERRTIVGPHGDRHGCA